MIYVKTSEIEGRAVCDYLAFEFIKDEISPNPQDKKCQFFPRLTLCEHKQPIQCPDFRYHYRAFILRPQELEMLAGMLPSITRSLQ